MASHCDRDARLNWAREFALLVGFPPFEKRILDLLVYMASPRGDCHISKEELALAAGRSLQDTDYALHTLKTVEVIHVAPARCCDCDLYWLTGAANGWAPDPDAIAKADGRRPSAERQQLWHDQAGFCNYCRQPIFPTGKSSHIDHITPRSKDGGNEYENLQLLCHRCNLVKGNKIIQ